MLRELVVLTVLSGVRLPHCLRRAVRPEMPLDPTTLSGQPAQTTNDRQTQPAKGTARHPSARQAPDDSHYVPPS